jgi:hypothetical protein
MRMRRYGVRFITRTTGCFGKTSVSRRRAGSLQPVIGVHGLGALTCEIIERIQKQPGGSYPGEVIATGGDTLVNDFAAIVSFALDITCITDLELYADWWQASGPAWARTRCPRNTFPVCLMAP